MDSRAPTIARSTTSVHVVTLPRGARTTGWLVILPLPTNTPTICIVTDRGCTAIAIQKMQVGEMQVGVKPTKTLFKMTGSSKLSFPLHRTLYCRTNDVRRRCSCPSQGPSAKRLYKDFRMVRGSATHGSIGLLFPRR